MITHFQYQDNASLCGFEEFIERCRRMLDNGAIRQQVADVTGVDVKTIYKYLPAT
ncbi:TPA: hypothetical protein MIG60_10345 [Klebsiella pneumoniae]|nr:hypothetical protein [Klebsiella pneumoniae]